MPGIILFLEPPVQICWIVMETMPSILVSFPTTWKPFHMISIYLCVHVLW